MGTAVQALLRGLNLLEVIAALGGRANFRKICERADLAPATTHRLLSTLVSAGYVIRDGGNAYLLAHRILNLSGSVHRRTAHIRVVVRPYIEALADDLHELVNLVALDGRYAVYIDQVNGSDMQQMSIHPGSIFPVNTSASAKAILAYRPEYDLYAAFMEDHVRRYTRRTVVDLATFRSNLREVRERGFAIEREELELGVSCVAAPILDVDGHAVAALSIPGPTARILGSDRIGKTVKRYADLVTAAMKDASKGGGHSAPRAVRDG